MANSFQRVSWIDALLFSLNLAWVAVWYEQMRPGSVIFKFGGWQMRHRFWLRISGANYGPYAVFDQFFWGLVFALAILIAFYLLKCIWTPGYAFRVSSGIIAIAGFPLVVLHFLPFSLTDSIRLFQWHFPRTFVALAAGEISVAIFCEALYLLRKWPLTTIPTVSLLVAHFGLWAWLGGMWIDPLHRNHENTVAAFISAICYFGFPIFGLLASLSWARYVRNYSGSQSATI